MKGVTLHGFIPGWAESSCNSCIRKSENKFPYLVNVFTLTNNHINSSATSTLYASRKNIRIKTLQIVIHCHYRSQNSCYKENSSDLRTDEYRWVQYLENMQDDSSRRSLWDVGLVNWRFAVKKQHITPKFPTTFFPNRRT